MSWPLLLLTAFIAWTLWTCIALYNNYMLARHIGFPIVISPFSTLNPVWILAQKLFPTLLRLRNLPFGLGRWVSVSYLGWTFHAKYSLHMELGDAITVVTPSLNQIYIADPEASHAIQARRKDFIKPAMLYKPMDVFGPTLNTVEGDDWQRHRRLTAPSFNERTSVSVWSEAMKQAEDMLQLWVDQGTLGTRETVGNTATLTLHVLASAGFGISYSFHKGLSIPQEGHGMTYRDALLLILQNIVYLAILPKELLKLPIFPGGMRKLGQATGEFKKYMEEVLENERAKISESKSPTGNLVSALIRASEDAKQSSGKDASNFGLADDEIYGNIFMYNLAGYETTANVIAYTIVLLAAYPQWQKWIAEEITDVLGSRTESVLYDYEEIFPKLKRCLAVMFETLRLYGSVVFIPRTPDSYAQAFRVDAKEHVIPPGTIVNINSQGLHTHPQYWAPDPLSWRPDRWLVSDSRQPSVISESFMEPAKGAFVAWSDGPRSCPGRKFAQVEFVAVIATLFRDHRVRPVLLDGETLEGGKERLLTMVNDSAISAITLQMQNPQSVALMWQK